jgi:Xaa-Pro aminopeptidase
MIKDKEEIDYISKACEITDACFEHLKSYIKVGLTEKQIAKEIEEFFLSNGAEDLAFETIVASGKNSSMPHAVPTDKAIEAGDPITIDMGCKYNGYCSDMTRTIFAKYVPEDIKEIYELVLKNQKQVIEEMKEGANLKLVSRMVQGDFKLRGYDLIHSLGHGVGLEIHELPYASAKYDCALKNNMVITDEPGIYIPNKFGVRIEDTLWINKGTSTPLTKSEKNYVVVDQ